MSATRFTTVGQVIESFPNLRTDIAPPAPDLDPVDAVTQLGNGATPEDAVILCAYVLDRRRAVWWSAQCVRKLGSPRGHEEDVALKTAEAWVRDPEEHRRGAALKIGLYGNHDQAGTWVALSAGTSGGAMRTDGLPGAPVPSELCAKAASTAILIALATQPPRDRRGHIVSCIRVGQELLTRA